MRDGDELLQWPSWMPLPQQNDYSYEPTDRRSRSDMEVGSILRVNFDTDETTVSCTIICDRIQAMWFECFERDTLRQGARWFEIPLQSGGTIDWHTARFASRPKASIKAPCYTQYSFKLDLDARELFMCDEIAALLVCVSPQDFLTSVSNVKLFVAGLNGLDVDWNCIDDEERLKRQCPDAVSCAVAVTGLFVDGLGKLKDMAK